MTSARKANILLLFMVVIHIIGSFTIGRFVSDTRLIIIISQLMILIPVIVYIVITRQNLFKLIRVNKIGIKTIILVIIFTYLMMPLLNIINALSMFFASNFIAGTLTNAVGGNFLIGFLLIAILPGLVEEITYRGVIYNSFKGERPLKAMVLSGLVFGAMHMNFNQFIYAAFLGIVMALLIEATNSIISTMIMHIVFNGHSVVLMYMLPKIQRLVGINPDITQITNSQLTQSIIALIPVAVVTTILAIILFRLIARTNNRWDYIKSIFRKKEKHFIGYSKNNKVLDLFLILVFAICFIYSFLIEVI